MFASLCRVTCVAVLFGATAILRAEEDALARLERLAGAWVKIRSETGKLDEDWSIQRNLVESMIKAQEQRMQPLESRCEELKQKIEKDRSEADTQTSKNLRMDEQLKQFEAGLVKFDERLILLRPKLPPRLSTALELAFRSLESPSTSVSERMQLSMAVLTRCLQFNRQVTCGDEIVSIEGENQKLMKTVYLGLTVGYAWDCVSGRTWIGNPSGGGWKWNLYPEAGEAVKAFVAAHEDKAEPGFVRIPSQTAQKH